MIITPFERLQTMMDGRAKELDRVPNLNILMFFAAKYINKPFGQFCTDYRILVEGNLRCVEKFGIDILSTLSDPMREAADFGTELIIPEDEIPHPKQILLPDIGDVEKLQLFNPWQSVRILDRIHAIKLFKKEKRDVYPVMGWVEGPLAEACDLHTMTESLMDIFINEHHFRQLLEKCTQQAILCAKAQLEAGAHIIGIGDAAVSQIDRDLYKNMILPYEKRIVDAIKEVGGIARLHICGDINHLLEDIVTLDLDIMDIDWMVDMKRTVEIFDGISVVNGNIDPVAVMLNGSVSDVKNAVRQCRIDSKGKACISSGCEIPKFTPYENLLAFSEALFEKI